MKATFLVPVLRNDGSAVSDREMRSILTSCFSRFGGFTRGASVLGAYRSVTGKRMDDETIPVTIVCERSRLGEVLRFVQHVGRKLGQEAMYLDVQEYDGVQFLDC